PSPSPQAGVMADFGAKFFVAPLNGFLVALVSCGTQLFDLVKQTCPHDSHRRQRLASFLAQHLVRLITTDPILGADCRQGNVPPKEAFDFFPLLLCVLHCSLSCLARGIAPAGEWMGETLLWPYGRSACRSPSLKTRVVLPGCDRWPCSIVAIATTL